MTHQAPSAEKKVFIVYKGRFPSEQTHALFVAKSAESFASLGYTVSVLAPRHHTESTDPQKFFGLKLPVPVIYIDAIDFRKYRFFKKIMYLVSTAMFALGVRKYLKIRCTGTDYVIVNDHLTLPFFSGFTVCYELHDFPERMYFLHSFFYTFAKKILVTNTWKETELHKYFPNTKGKTFVVQNAVDIETYAITKTREEARRELAIHSVEKIILYTGHLFSWKGVDVLISVAAQLPLCKFYFVGGTPTDVAAFKAKTAHLNNVTVVGHQPHGSIPIWQKAADVLVLPNTAKEKVSKYYTSPMKLFEYLASGVPVVSSDIPSIRDIVSEKEVFFAEPDNPSSFVTVITEALSLSIASEKTLAGVELVKSHTWIERTKRITAQLEVQ